MAQRGGGGGGGGILIVSYIHKLESFFGVQNLEFQYFRGVPENIYIFWGYEDFVDIFWGSSQIWTIIYLGVISMHFRIFS